MKLKKIKLFSGLLSVTALASIAANPVLANETTPEGPSITDAHEKDSDSSVSGFLGLEDGDKSESSEEEADQSVVKDSAQKSEKIKDTGKTGTEGAESAEQSTVAAFLENSDLSEEALAEEEVYKEAVDCYNDMVLPELSVSLSKKDDFNGSSIPGVTDVFQTTSTDSSTSRKPEAADQKIVVASPNVYLNLHAEPSLGSEVVGKMYGNDVAVVLRKENDRWSRVRSGNVIGYAMNEYLVEGEQAQALSDIASSPYVKVEKGKNKEIHQDSDDYSKVIAKAEAGDQYEVVESGDGWIGILTDEGEGYIQTSDVTLSMAYPVAESSRQEAERKSKSNVKERADHEDRKAKKADAVAEVAQARADLASGQEEETAMAVVEVALRAADAAAAQANVAQVAVSQAGAESGQAVIEFATQFIGNPYVWGGTSLTHGADCSGFVMSVYGNFGFRLPHYDAYQRSVGAPVASLSEARAGDIVCYYGHVGLYMGDGMIVHAQDERHGITTSRADFMHIVCIRRLFN